MLANNGCLSQASISKELNITTMTVYRNIGKLKQMGLLERKESDKTGVWVVNRHQ
jgi:DNA-binding MarR family transcriptional regulator